MVRYVIWRMILVAVAAAIVWLLITRLGLWPGLGVWAAGTAVAGVVGAVLLRTSTVGRVSWKNYVAGYLLPFGYRIASGTLVGIVLISWCIWMLIAAGVVFALHGPSAPGVAPSGAEAPASWLMVGLLFASWTILAGGMFYLLGNAVRYQTFTTRAVRPILGILILLALLLATSVTLWLNAHPKAALLVAGLPIALVGGFFGLVMIIFLIFGRNMRWN